MGSAERRRQKRKKSLTMERLRKGTSLRRFRVTYDPQGGPSGVGGALQVPRGKKTREALVLVGERREMRELPWSLSKKKKMKMPFSFGKRGAFLREGWGFVRLEKGTKGRKGLLQKSTITVQIGRKSKKEREWDDHIAELQPSLRGSGRTRSV